MKDDQKKAGGPAFLTRYGEKLALGASLAALGIGALVMFGLNGRDPGVPVRSATQKLTAEMAKGHGGAPRPDAWQAKSVGNWNKAVAPARAGDDWAASGPTLLQGVTTYVCPGPPLKTYKVPEVRMGRVDVQVDHILLNWTIQHFTQEDKQKNAKVFDFGSITHFKLERESKGTWEVLEPKLDAQVLSYRDTRIEPKTAYAYRVTACSTEKGFLERGTPDVKVGAKANKDGLGNTVAASVRSLGLFKLSFSNPQKPDPAAKGRVFLTIEKFEKGAGKLTINRIHEEGDEIGIWAETTGIAPTSVHKISVPPGRALPVDWNTGATLVTVQPLKVTVNFEKCKTKNSAQGNLGCDQIVEPRPVATTLIVYTDADGRHELYSPALPDPNEKCPGHGGPRAMTPAGTTVPLAKTDADPFRKDLGQ